MICTKPDCTNYTEGNTDLCASHNHERRKLERVAQKEVKPVKIRKVSPKRSRELAQYEKLRKQYLAIHQVCEFIGCFKLATDIHHCRGRENELLLDVNYFKALCREHHARVHDHSKEAIEQGYSLPRNQKL